MVVKSVDNLSASLMVSVGLAPPTMTAAVQVVLPIVASMDNATAARPPATLVELWTVLRVVVLVQTSLTAILPLVCALITVPWIPTV